MGGSSSMCLGRSRRRKYRVNEPYGATRNDVFAKFSDFGIKDDAFYLGYRRDFEENSKVTREDVNSQQKELMKEVCAEEGGETEKSLIREEGHIHDPLPQGIEADTTHPDLPQGVTCVTCAATMMENGQSKEETVQETADNGAAGVDEKNGDVDGTPDGSESSENKEKSDEDENQSCLGKGSEADGNSASGDKLSRGSRRRRRYKALSNVPPAVLRSDVF